MRAAVILVAVTGVLTACTIGPLATRPRPEVWLLMGQSNMSGRGDLAELPADALRPDARILTYGNDRRLDIAREPVDSATGQFDAVSADDLAGVGPGLAFARERVNRRRGRRIILVPCAKGGTSVTAWAPNQQATSLYGSCLARAREAMRFGRVAGALWYQGETDTASEALAARWSRNFTEMVVALRSNPGFDSITLLVVGLGEPPVHGPYAGNYPAWERVRSAQHALAVHNLIVIPAAGLPKMADDLHLSTPGQLSLGVRLADAAERAVID